MHLIDPDLGNDTVALLKKTAQKTTIQYLQEYSNKSKYNTQPKQMCQRESNCAEAETNKVLMHFVSYWLDV